jgi:ribosomal-protein-alanine N-acetyltransferase
VNLRTQRLTLTATTDNDFTSLTTIVTNDYVRKYLFDDEVLEPLQITDILFRSINSFQQKAYGLWLIRYNDHDETIGMVGLWEFFEEPQPQLLYALLPEHTGKGIATEASRAILHYCFDTLGFKYLNGSCDTPNVSSHKVATRLGMVMTKQDEVNGKPITFYRIEKIITPKDLRGNLASDFNE